MFEAIIRYIQGEIKGIQNKKERINIVENLIDSLYKFKTDLILEKD